MAARASLIWPEVIASGYSDPEYSALIAARGLPEFRDPNWADWRMFMEDYEDVLRGLGCGALLSYTTEGLPWEQIEWVSPAAMVAAADHLADLVANNAPEVAPIVEEYQDLYRRDGKPHAVQLVEDLREVKAQAQFLQGLGKTRVAFDLQV
jgi:hypothetical protein